MTLRQKFATCALGALACYGVAESTDRKDLNFSGQYLNPAEIVDTYKSDNRANAIGAIGFDAFSLGAAYVLLGGSKKK